MRLLLIPTTPTTNMVNPIDKNTNLSVGNTKVLSASGTELVVEQEMTNRTFGMFSFTGKVTIRYKKIP